MRAIGAGLEFRMELDANVKGPVGQLHRFDQMSVGTDPAQGQTGVLHFLTVVVVEFIPVPVPLRNLQLAITGRQPGPGQNGAGIFPQPHGAAYANFNCPKPNNDLKVSYIGIVT